MSRTPEDQAKLDALEKRLSSLSDKVHPPEPEEPRNPRGSVGSGMKMSTDLVAATVVGTGLGWMIDYMLGTLPWFLLLFFLLGTAAGIRMVFRTAMRESNKRSAEKITASQKASDDA